MHCSRLRSWTRTERDEGTSAHDPGGRPGGRNVGHHALRRHYPGELTEALRAVGGRTRKRTCRRTVETVSAVRGAELTTSDEDVLVWSDLHLGHGNIIDYQDRPFLDREDMDEELWRAWSRVVKPHHTLVVVGDVAMGESVCEATWSRVRGPPQGARSTWWSATTT